jgi:hypothetical protein
MQSFLGAQIRLDARTSATIRAGVASGQGNMAGKGSLGLQVTRVIW